jgi:hypothetical protein
VPLEQTGIANGINSISRSVGAAIASAVVTSLLTSKTIPHLPTGIHLPQESQFTLSFVIALGVMSLTGIVAVVGLTTHHTPAASAATPVPTTPVAQETRPHASVRRAT